MNKRTLWAKQYQAGFSLIEIMVAVVISMLAMVVVLQIFGSSESKKRATTGGNDAQMGGVVALAGLQRDIRQAGYGFASRDLFGCSVALRAGVTLQGLAPVTINHAGLPGPTVRDPDTDSLLIVYGVSGGGPEGDSISSQPGGNQFYAMFSPLSFPVGDWVIAAPAARATPCSLTLNQVTAAPAASSVVITLSKQVGGMAGGRLYNLGHDASDSTRGPQILAYLVRKGNLKVCDYMLKDCGATSNVDDDDVWVPTASNIVSLRAQYGRDTTPAPRTDNAIELYDQTTPTTACDISRVGAVRLALVARSGEYDKTAVTTASPTWEGSVADAATGSTAAPINLASIPASSLPSGATWQNYRYKLFQTVVPIRTTTWMQPQTGCL